MLKAHFQKPENEKALFKFLEELAAPGSPKAAAVFESAKALAKKMSMEEGFIVTALNLISLMKENGFTMPDLMHLVSMLYSRSVPEEQLTKEINRMATYYEELKGIPTPAEVQEVLDRADQTLSPADLERMFNDAGTPPSA